MRLWTEAPVGGSCGSTVLLVGPEEPELFALRNICAGVGWKFREVRTIGQARAWLGAHPVSVVVCGRKVCDGEWTQLLDVVQSLSPPALLVVWACDADATLWAEVLNLGAYDVLAAPFRVAEVVHVIRLATEAWPQKPVTRIAPLRGAALVA